MVLNPSIIRMIIRTIKKTLVEILFMREKELVVFTATSERSG